MLRRFASTVSGACVAGQVKKTNKVKHDVPVAPDETPADRLKNFIGNVLKDEFGGDVIVDEFVTKNLTAPGENNGSTMFAVIVTVRRNESALPEVIHAVAKMLPNEIFQKLFDSQVSFPKEIAAYREIFPAYQQLQRENGVSEDKVFDISPKCFGARMPRDLKARSRGDEAVILLDNLKVSGFSCGNRVEGLDLAHSELVVRNLAAFHALGIATRIRKPELFATFKPEQVIKLFPMNTIAATVERRKVMASQSDRLNPFYQRIVRAMDEGVEKLYATASNHFGTIGHGDFWVANVMFHHDTNGNPDAVRFVDFQTYSYQSPVRDFLFFVIGSTSETVLLRHFDHLFDLYHRHFIETLEEAKCDVSAYGEAQFLAECKEWAPAVVVHCCMMLKVILLSDSQAEADSKLERSAEYFENLDFEACRERLTLMFQCFLERNWI